eukprot:7413547-Pyramimonas_sp.AAC.1
MANVIRHSVWVAMFCLPWPDRVVTHEHKMCCRCAVCDVVILGAGLDGTGCRCLRPTAVEEPDGKGTRDHVGQHWLLPSCTLL